jgi:hypothetical protein
MVTRAADSFVCRIQSILMTLQQDERLIAGTRIFTMLCCVARIADQFHECLLAFLQGYST